MLLGLFLDEFNGKAHILSDRSVEIYFAQMEVKGRGNSFTYV